MWIKICGITDRATAGRIAAMGPDAIGLNFFARSPRAVTLPEAARITAELPSAVAAVGVFVNAGIEELVETAQQCRLPIVQVHGDESPEFLAEVQSRLPGCRLIRAWRMGTTLADLEAYLAECTRCDVRLMGCLIDAKVSGSYGGTGHTPPWDVLRTFYRYDQWPPLILAGGLTPLNVSAGIREVRPWGVDVASGVESAPGTKDLTLVEQFITAARAVNPKA